jgi:hypothetical protein
MDRLLHGHLLKIQHCISKCTYHLNIINSSFSCSLCIILNEFVIYLSTLVIYELQYDVSIYAFRKNCSSIFAFQKFGMSFAKLLFQICEGFSF